MTQFTKWFYLLTLVVWIGTIIFFSFVVAPTVFKILKLEDAAKLQRALFPNQAVRGEKSETCDTSFGAAWPQVRGNSTRTGNPAL